MLIKGAGVADKAVEERGREIGAEEIKRSFKKSQRRFYWINFWMTLIVAAALSLATHYGVYREAFGFILLVFFVWIFNVDKLRRCPRCRCVPRDRRQGLLSVPRQCVACGVDLL